MYSICPLLFWPHILVMMYFLKRQLILTKLHTDSWASVFHSGWQECAGVHPSCHGVKSGCHSGQMASSSPCHMERKTRTFSHSHQQGFQLALHVWVWTVGESYWIQRETMQTQGEHVNPTQRKGPILGSNLKNLLLWGHSGIHFTTVPPLQITIIWLIRYS